VPVTFLEERPRLTRRSATIVTMVALAATGSLAALSSSSLARFALFGKNMFDLFGYATSSITLAVGGLCFCLFVG